ncbi:2-keto-4-pentenoate hydratase/2-oxohepta-3-ene-1,7-dioic acid hydratase (catechol pathway) [Granulicella rosea]|uniref:2-keto-4-pentenoate hydratase/2-oxohepta-3-ene-1,7-dioic acid hydratase (Catechol pathway) n=1 Tax=Granulicella rosea TaxID=474952 RepID=A0A239ESN5_9BACT|nr:fumarylacetoacetate hydrolase family protein [Granulicella rosea]SNS46874.1 2-keto-4-pentenoate hydratase/2-oxohepta-3-ene-1,7-dioic acid hydratase (catechol pathway) [Granulicella rosea]
MKFVSYVRNGAAGSGVLEGDVIRVIEQKGVDALLAYLRSGAKAPPFTGETVELKDVSLTAPLMNPPRIFGIGLNYREHAAESKMTVQKVPTVFLKLSSSITGPDSDVLLPPNATEPDYEAELAVVIGKPGHKIAAGDWEQYVFGYTIVNDVSARGVQLATSQWNLGKSFPTFTPMGPWIVSSDEVKDAHALGISLTLSGETMQSANTRDLIFRIPQLIEYISSILPLEAGDVISTGTPPGVGLGRTPRRWLQDGEEMVIAIESIGELRNRTRAVE